MKLEITLRRCDSDEEAVAYVFEQEQIPFGRLHDNLLVVEDEEKQISSRHGRFERRGSEWFVVDTGSTNGTQLDGEFLVAGEPARVTEASVIIVGDYELRTRILDRTDPLEQTMVQFDAERHADRLALDLSLHYAEYSEVSAAERRVAIGKQVREAISGFLPEQARAVLSLLDQKMSNGPNTEVTGEVERREELYRAGHQILRDLATRYVGPEEFKNAEEIGRFAWHLDQTLRITLDWLARCLEGRREFETQFGADVTMMFSMTGNPLKNGKNAEQIGRYLLDWRTERDGARVRKDLENAFRDLTLHQLGLLQGAQEAVKAVLVRLSPEAMEGLAQSKQKGWLKALPGGQRVWDYYKQAYAELFEEKTRLYDELISPSIRKGYLMAHEKEIGSGSSRDAGAAQGKSASYDT